MKSGLRTAVKTTLIDTLTSWPFIYRRAYGASVSRYGQRIRRFRRQERIRMYYVRLLQQTVPLTTTDLSARIHGG
jgi:hypothetical protein